MAAVNLAALIDRRQKDGRPPAGAGSLRDMEASARVAGYEISRSTLNELAHGKPLDVRDQRRLAAVAAALRVSSDEVRSAALESLGPPTPLEGHRAQHAEAFLRLTSQRSDEEIEHLLGVVAATLRAMDVQRSDRH